VCVWLRHVSVSAGLIALARLNTIRLDMFQFCCRSRKQDKNNSRIHSTSRRRVSCRPVESIRDSRGIEAFICPASGSDPPNQNRGLYYFLDRPTMSMSATDCDENLIAGWQLCIYSKRFSTVLNKSIAVTLRLHI